MTGRARSARPSSRRRQPPALGRRSRAPPGRSAAPRRSARQPRALRLGALNGRLRYGFAAVCTLLLVIGGRLVQLQGLDGSNYAGAAAAQRVDTIALHALRGQIVDRDGTVLAYTSDAQDITADPSRSRPPPPAARSSPTRGDRGVRRQAGAARRTQRRRVTSC